MEWIQLPDEFNEFLRLLSIHRVEYLIVGGVAVASHGYQRTTGDMDIWVSPAPENANRLAAALRDFGFSAESVGASLFTHPSRLIQIGQPPLRLEIMTSASGVEFSDCFSRRIVHTIDGFEVFLISLEDLRKNKAAVKPVRQGRPCITANHKTRPMANPVVAAAVISLPAINKASPLEATATKTIATAARLRSKRASIRLAIASQ